MPDVPFDGRAHVQEELLVHWAVPVLGTPGGK
jgi:hypothetical protein